MVLSTLIANMNNGNYSYIDYVSLQCTPFTATDEYLEGWAALKNIFREAATASVGTAVFVGTTGTIVPVGTILVTQDGTQFATQIATTVGIYTSSSPFQCLTVGSAYNYPAGTAIKMQTPIAGVSSVNMTLGGVPQIIGGGTDTETDASLQNRSLQAWQSSLTGGSQSDFVKWTLGAPGVTRAWCYPNPSPTTNIVTCYAMLDVINAAYNGFPQGTNGSATGDNRYTISTGDQNNIANIIYPLRPVTSVPIVCAPIALPINITINPLITDNPTTEAAIAAAIATMFVDKGTPLGGVIYQSDITAAIASVADVTEYVLTTPTAITNIPLGYLPTVGNLVFE